MGIGFGEDYVCLCSLNKRLRDPNANPYHSDALPRLGMYNSGCQVYQICILLTIHTSDVGIYGIDHDPVCVNKAQHILDNFNGMVELECQVIYIYLIAPSMPRLTLTLNLTLT